MQLLILTIFVMALVMVAMAIGVIVSNRRLRGSCGGPPMLGPDGEAMTCPECNCRTPEVDLGAPPQAVRGG